MKLALFDFDGTITTDDSLLKFIRFVVGDVQFVFGLIFLSPVLIAYKLKIIPNYRAKQKMLSYFFKGISESEFKNIAQSYSLKHIDKIVRKSAISKINWHKKEGHRVVVVSASIECWLKPWCDNNSLELIGTKLEIKDGLVTGKLIGKNCFGKEKVNRINENYDLTRYSYIYVYGDSRGDKEMLDLADEKFYKYFEE